MSDTRKTETRKTRKTDSNAPARPIAASGATGSTECPSADADAPATKKSAKRFGTGSRFFGKKGRSGPPTGNRNNLRHGLRGGQLPKDAKFIEVRMNAFRRQLEDAVIAAKGEVGIPDAAYIQTAMRWERHGCLAQRWLTKSYNTMDPATRLQFSREIARASAERDKAIAMLELGKKKPASLQSYLTNGGGDA